MEVDRKKRKSEGVEALTHVTQIVRCCNRLYCSSCCEFYFRYQSIDWLEDSFFAISFDAMNVDRDRHRSKSSEALINQSSVLVSRFECSRESGMSNR